MNICVSLAKQAVETYIKKREIISPPDDFPSKFLKKKAGVFITIEKNGELRGCVGTYLPSKNNIAEEIISNAAGAANEDYRFSPIQKKEIPYLSYTVYILSKLKKVFSTKSLNPKKYGVIVKSGLKTGLLLPFLKGIDTAEKQISIACQKAAINLKKEQIEIWRFKTEKHK